MSALAAIHVAKKQLGLDDDTYRAMLVRVTGKASTKDMTEAERNRVVEELRGKGFKPASKGLRKKLEGRYAAKLQALWIAGWNLGIVRDRTDEALIAFVQRQTHVDHVRFLHDPEDAMSAIEGLKGWLAREAGVDWTHSRFLPVWTQVDGYRIAKAQWAILRKADSAMADYAELDHWAVRHVDNDFKSWLADDAAWIRVMNALGGQVRRIGR